MKRNLLLLLALSLGFLSEAQHNKVSLIYHWEDTTLTGSSIYDNVYNEVWGFVQAGREYAVIGSSWGTHIFDVTDGTNIYMVDEVMGADTGGVIIHRDYHDYQGYLYAVSDEGNSTLQIMDLSSLPDSVTVVYDSDALIRRAHNIFIDTATGKFYANSAHTPNGIKGLQCYDLSNPVSPTHLSDYGMAGFTHDTYAKNDTVFINAGTNGLYIMDFSNGASPTVMTTLTDYPFKGYNHSGWPTDDMQYYFMADENAGHKMKTLDVSNFSNIQVLSLFGSEIDTTYSMPHNQIWKDGFLYVAHYHDGLQIYDVRNPLAPVNVGSYETYPFTDHQTLYKGAWGVYPLLPSGKVLVSDMQFGLFVLDASDAVSLEENQTLSFNLYPNPSADFVTIELPETWNQAEMRIYSLNGALVQQRILRDKLSPLHHELASGFYLVELRNKGEKLVQKLVVNY